MIRKMKIIIIVIIIIIIIITKKLPPVQGPPFMEDPPGISEP
jgi:hypothetical protein